MSTVYIVDAVRSPIGKYKGALKSVRPDDLAAQVLKELIARNTTLPVEKIDDVILGNANGAGEDNRNVARMATLLAGLPVSVSAVTVNRLCGSGLEAVSTAARAIKSGEAHIVIAGGVESMTRAPFVMAKPDSDFPRGDATLYDTTIGWRFINERLQQMYGTELMPQTSDNVAKRYNISREAQDAFALESQHRAQVAVQQHKFNDEIVPIEIVDRKGRVTSVTQDEHIRFDVTLEQLQKLKPLYDGGTVTAGNASGINDGAAALLLVSEQALKEYGLKPIAKYVGAATKGVEPTVMGIGPVLSTQKLMAQHNYSVQDFDLVELNEAFASQSLACIQLLGLDTAKVNVNGGAIALGHPLGASGARILTTLIYELRRRQLKTGLATMCIGVGQGISLAIEAINE